MTSPVTCAYCHRGAELVSGVKIYPHRLDLRGKSFWRCEPCAAWVGCHPGTVKPLGRLANAELRRAKMKAHAAFDPLWKSGVLDRHSAYAWLAEVLGVSRADCHIGMMDVDACKAVVAAVASRGNAPRLEGGRDNRSQRLNRTTKGALV